MDLILDYKLVERILIGDDSMSRAQYAVKINLFNVCIDINKMGIRVRYFFP